MHNQKLLKFSLLAFSFCGVNASKKFSLTEFIPAVQTAVFNYHEKKISQRLAEKRRVLHETIDFFSLN